MNSGKPMQKIERRKMEMMKMILVKMKKVMEMMRMNRRGHEERLNVKPSVKKKTSRKNKGPNKK